MTKPDAPAQQVAALCVRSADSADPQVLLVTSRTTARWILPKGWPVPGHSLADSAAIEAWEEGGIRGRVSEPALGTYRYVKRSDAPPREIEVRVFPLAVDRQFRAFPEMGQRKQRWVSLTEAADLVDEPDLKTLLRDLARSPLRLSSTAERLS